MSLLLIATFVWENRSGNLTNTNQALENFIQNYMQYSPGDTAPPVQYKDTVNTVTGLNFISQQMKLIITTYSEDMPNSTWFGSKFGTAPISDLYSLTNWRFIMHYNIFMGAKLNIDFVPSNGTFQSISYFVPSDVSPDNFTSRILDIENKIFVEGQTKLNDVKSVAMELLFYNVNLETGAYYKYLFAYDSVDGFIKSYERITFLPRVNDVNSSYVKQEVVFWIIRIVHFVYMIFVVFFLFKEYNRFFFLLINKKILDYSAITFFKTATLVVYCIYTYKYATEITSPPPDISTPISNAASFDYWISSAKNQQSIYVYCSILIILLAGQLVQMVFDKFYTTLNIVSGTLAQSILVVAAYIAIVLILIFCFAIFGTLFISYYDVGFTSISASAELISLNIFQSLPYKNLSLVSFSNSSIYRQIFYYMLFIVFNTYAMQLVFSIMNIAYGALKEKYEIAIQSSDKYKSASTNSSWEIFKHLISFQIIPNADNRSAIEEAQKYERIESTLKELLGNLENKRIQGAKKVIENPIETQGNNLVPTMGDYQKALKSVSSPDIKRISKQPLSLHQKLLEEQRQLVEETYLKKPMKLIFWNNLEILGLGAGLSNETNLISRDKYMSNISLFRGLIVKKNERNLSKKLADLSNRAASKLVGLILYLAYIYLFSTILTRHTQIFEKYKSYTSFLNNTSSERFRNPNYYKSRTFMDISTLSDFNAWVSYFSTLYPNATSAGADNSRVIASRFEQITEANAIITYQKKYMFEKAFITGKDETTNVKNVTLFMQVPFTTFFYIPIASYYKQEADINPALVACSSSRISSSSISPTSRLSDSPGLIVLMS